MMQSKKGCLSLEEITMHDNVCHLSELECCTSRKGLKQTREGLIHGFYHLPNPRCLTNSEAESEGVGSVA